MLLPILQAKENPVSQIVSFAGLDLRPKAKQGTLLETENLCADAYPALTTRQPREKVVSMTGITAFCAPEETGEPLTAFTGVKDRRFYYQGTQIGDELLEAGEKSIADFNGKICIFPDKVYYDYLPDPDTGTVSQTLCSMEQTQTLTGVNFYSAYNETTGAYTAYLSKSGADFSAWKPGDSLVIRGCAKTQNNTCVVQGRKDYAAEDAIVSVVVESVETGRMNLLLYQKRGGLAKFENGTESGSITIGRSIPDMNHVCVHNNRLFGTAKNGEYLYASKLGDCMNFHTFAGLDSDSWYSAIGTPGSFTGICSYRTAVVAFKSHCIHHVYGDTPRNFSIPKQTAGGCVDGRSIAEIGGILYYLSAAGFYAYQGGEPYAAAPQLTGRHDRYCAAGTDGQRYYAAASADGTHYDLLVYDPALNLWYREDDTAFFDFVFYGGSLYAAAPDGIWRYHCGSETVSWSLTTHPITLRTMTHKGVPSLRLRLWRGEDTSVKIEVSHDGGAFVTAGKLHKKSGFGVSRIPVRFQKCDSFQLRISGSGPVVLHDLELVTYQGGKTYGI